MEPDRETETAREGTEEELGKKVETITFTYESKNPGVCNTVGWAHELGRETNLSLVERFII